MDVLETILTAIALAMDCLSISVAFTIGKCFVEYVDIIKMGTSFGAFQTLMPMLGWLIAINVVWFVKDFSHWIAFLLLCSIGSKFIYESMKNRDDTKVSKLSVYMLLSLSIATSIDAFTVGVSFGLLMLQIIFPAILFGITSFLFTLLGSMLGRMLSIFFKGCSRLIGGIILIGIGVKILLESIML